MFAVSTIKCAWARWPSRRSPKQGERKYARRQLARQEILAASTIKSPPHVVPADDRDEQNARLIAEVRNVLPERLRLARLALSTE